MILISFKLLDRVLPQIDSRPRGAWARGHWVKKPWPMFLLGCLVALLTLSVSVAITVMVPLAAKGYIDRREAMPYIMGANITTLADTLVAAMILGKAGGRADRPGRGHRRGRRSRSSTSLPAIDRCSAW